LVYEKLNAEISNKKKLFLNKTESTMASIDENPIAKFNKIKSEIDLIEKDLEFYSKNVKYILIFRKNHLAESIP